MGPTYDFRHLVLRRPAHRLGEVQALVRQSYGLIAPKRLTAHLEAE
jgi:hypothetical protein